MRHWRSVLRRTLQRAIVPIATSRDAILLSAFGRKRPRRAILVEEAPAEIRHDNFYIIGEGQHRWAALLRCPCGCGDLVELSLHKEGRPRWHVFEHLDGTITVKPSIWRTDGCRSHFYVRRGRIQWCSVGGGALRI